MAVQGTDADAVMQRCNFTIKYEGGRNMKYVCDVCGWEYDEEKGYPEGVLHQVQNGRMYRMILSVHYVV